ncbi:HNH endonuclease [Cytobacillus praedii]|uniref:HNH endonuclease n=1 Tax=Cytobacillus praedii TaxID=1742358 RepID=UPI00070AA6D5|nr:HNH endonuclease [Cytobacillus praedii]
MDLGFHPVAKPSYSRRVKKRGDRNKFSKYVRDQIKDHFEDTCQMCMGRGCHIHHVQPKGSGKGRGVFTNGLLLCNECHKKVHADDALLRYWKKVFRKKYGPLYFMDEEDIKAKQLTKELQQEEKAVREWKNYNGNELC